MIGGVGTSRSLGYAQRNSLILARAGLSATACIRCKAYAIDLMHQASLCPAVASSRRDLCGE